MTNASKLKLDELCKHAHVRIITGDEIVRSPGYLSFFNYLVQLIRESNYSYDVVIDEVLSYYAQSAWMDTSGFVIVARQHPLCTSEASKIKFNEFVNKLVHGENKDVFECSDEGDANRTVVVKLTSSMSIGD